MNGICNLSITHKWASLNDLECARIDNVEGALKAMHATDGVSDCVIIQTCNRIELYLYVTNEFDVNSFITRFFPSVSPELIGRYEARESLRHLMRLASGLDSMIVGEDQILGQLKEAVEIATKEDTLGPDLGLALSKAIKVGKRVRTETHINRGSVSVGSAAVALAERELKAMFFSNRTFRRAQTLAKRLGGTAVRFDNIDDYLCQADLVISATAAPHYILPYDKVRRAMQQRHGQSLVIIDIANPRDVEESVATLDNVDLHNIDDLRKITEQNLKKRRSEIGKVVAIINQELDLLEWQYKKDRANDLIASLYQNAEELRARELEKAYNRLRCEEDLSKYEQILEDLTGSIVNKLLFELTASLREAAANDDYDLMSLAHKLFKRQEV